MRLALFDLDPASYQPHRLHGAERNWTETNCWLDMMIELLHVLGFDPTAALAGSLSTDFDGHQWALFKFPEEDLRALFGLEVDELYVWRPVIEHLADYLAEGHPLTVEVDAWYLPDTAGITYRTDHAKTGVVMQMLDREERRLGYFHNAGYFELEGEDFDGIFYLPEGRDPRILLPYVERINLSRIRPPDDGELLPAVIALTGEHLGRLPASNPMVRFGARMTADLEWLAAAGDEAFHPYAFATCRQVGANGEVAASFVDWLDAHDGGGLGAAADAYRSIAATAKGLEFTLARAARGRKVDLATPFEALAGAWEQAMETLLARYGASGGAGDRTGAGPMADDLLAGAGWTCCATAPGAVSEPGQLEEEPRGWLAASVPGTAAGAVAAVSGWREACRLEPDEADWWFRCRVPAGAPGEWRLVCEGLATVADVWFRGEHVLHGENMFVPYQTVLGAVAGDDELVLRFAALAPLLGQRRPRPRWKTQMVDQQGIRWFRTSNLGRQPGWVVTPAAVGPWRPVRLEPAASVRIVGRRLVARCEDDASGVVSVMVALDGVSEDSGPARLSVRRVGDDTAGTEAAEATATVRSEGSAVVVEGQVRVPAVERWWPQTHGPQPLYAVSLSLGQQTLALGRVGFRTVELERGDGAFRLLVNGVAVFCRGAGWWPVDGIGFRAGEDELRAGLALVTGAHMNMVRIPGGTVYEDERFWDLCDELGIMVWQDCMLGYTDPPEDEAFETAVVAELEAVFGRLGGRPALAVVCGGQEIEEQAAMFGLPREKWSCTLTEKTIPALAARLLPDVPYVTSSPSGGDIPFQPDHGDCHYWGVGSYLRPPSDARLSGIRFMSEGMGFAIPPETETMEQEWGGAVGAGHDPEWKRALHHDTGRSWDLEDVRDYYVGQLLGTDPHLLRYLDPERALDLGRAVTAELFARTFAEWRRPGSSCDGGLGMALKDLVPGAGWGFVDARGRPKAPWWSLRRVFAPLALIGTDEGLNGLDLHVLNDGGVVFDGEVTVTLFARGELAVEEASRTVTVAPRGHLTLGAGALFDGFRDVSYSHRFGPPAYDVVAARLTGADGTARSEVVFLPAGLDRPLEAEIGLAATARREDDGRWSLSVTTRRLAQWVVVEVPGYRPSDSWFHLAPGSTRTLSLERSDGGEQPAGQVRAVNAVTTARITLA